MYEVDFTIGMPEYGVLNVEAMNVDEAEMIALDRLKETYPDALDIKIEMIRTMN